MRPVSRLAGLALALLAVLACVSCVTHAPRAHRVSDAAQVLTGVPVARFGSDDCGAGSLSAVLTYLGDEVSPDELDAELPRAHKGGVLSIDLLLTARQRGHDARWARGDREQIVEALAAETPVILMLRVLDAPGRGSDLHHYVVVDGYDPRRGLFRFHFGDGRTRWSPLGRGLRRAWHKAGHALLLVGPGAAPGGPAFVAELRRAVALEREGRLPEASAVYEHLVQSAPTSARVRINQGNVFAQRGLTGAAEAAYRAALVLAPDDAEAANNLAWVLLESRSDLDEAERLARRAVERNSAERPLALDTLGRILVVRGLCGEASGVFRRGLSLTSADAAGLRALLLEGLAGAQRACGDARGARRLLEQALGEGPDAATTRAIHEQLSALRTGDPR